MLCIAAKLASDPNNQLPPEGAVVWRSRFRGPCLQEERPRAVVAGRLLGLVSPVFSLSLWEMAGVRASRA